MSTNETIIHVEDLDLLIQERWVRTVSDKVLCRVHGTHFDYDNGELCWACIETIQKWEQ